ncbi:G-protein coupled receptor Mth [Folsomia candida]|uniref:G-protein coupled receptor Mth n=1 Tax=Folsomia candida TaxID=158441 RepID=A0A226EFZ0_FOLCA|nr:G-protein coupled receptor Mth [Folsomia candida]
MVFKIFVIFLTLFCLVRCEIVNFGVCCSNKNCTKIQNDDTFSGQLFQEFLVKHQNLIDSGYNEDELTNVDFSERWIYQSISCPNGTSSLLVQNATEDVKLFLSNGYLKNGKDYLPPNEYCINKISPILDHMELIVCNPEKCSEEKPCSKSVPKCCPPHEVADFSLYQDGTVRCRPAGNASWSPMFYSDLHSKAPLTEIGIGQRPKVTISHPREWCRSSIIAYPLKHSSKIPKKDVFRILLDGSVWMKHDKWKWNLLAPGTFCLDGAKNVDDDASPNATFSGDFQDTVIIDCRDYSEVVKPCVSNVGTSKAYAVSFLVGSAFLLITVLVYILGEKKNVHGYTSIAYFGSMFAMYIFTGLSKLDYLTFFGNSGNYGCLIIAIGAHFFWLCTFCWMSCVNFSLWWTFRSLLPTGGKSKGLSRFMLYALFSLGTPSTIVGVAVVLDYFYKNDIESDIITPEYGKLNCFMNPEYALLPYLLVLFAKLVLLTGIPWCFEFVSWATTPCGEIPWYWGIFDYINIFQAFAIFVTFVCKSETINSLEAKFPTFKRIMLFVSISPEKSDDLLTRFPYLKFIVKPLTRRHKTSLRAVSSTKTTGVESSRNSTSHRNQFATK